MCISHLHYIYLPHPGMALPDIKAGAATEKMRAVLYLIVGNTRLHWAWVDASRYLHWNTDHSTAADDGAGVVKVYGIPTSFLPTTLHDELQHQHAASDPPPPTPPFRLLLGGEAVPPQHQLWKARCPHAHNVATPDALPDIHTIYPTLGVDRALALRGARDEMGAPCMVVDAGTALTFTVADREGQCAGGAIAPGLGLAVRSLATQTALLPHVALPALGGEGLPGRFACGTVGAIRAGVVHGALATVREYVAAFLEEEWGEGQGRGEWETTNDDCDCDGERPVVFTGGDAPLLFAALKDAPIAASRAGPRPKFLLRDDLAFRGLHSLARDKGWLPPGAPDILPAPVVAGFGAGLGVDKTEVGETHLEAAPCEHRRP